MAEDLGRVDSKSKTAGDGIAMHRIPKCDLC